MVAFLQNNKQHSPDMQAQVSRMEQQLSNYKSSY